MEMIKIHQDAIVNNTSIFHEFLSCYNKRKKWVYGFVEGQEDPSFYRGFIEQMIPEPWQVKLWVAGNKDKVLKIYSNIDWSNFHKKHILFFVDRDLSEFTNETIQNDINIYVTDNYSIENDVVNRTTCDRIISEIFNLSNLPENEKEIILDLFENQLLLFINALVPVMSWIIHWRRQKSNAYLNDICMNHLFRFKQGKIDIEKQPYGERSICDYIHARCNIAYDGTVNIKQIEDEFLMNNNHLKYTRGKYLLWFIIEFCLSVYNDIHQIVKSIKNPALPHP